MQKLEQFPSALLLCLYILYFRVVISVSTSTFRHSSHIFCRLPCCFCTHLAKQIPTSVTPHTSRPENVVDAQGTVVATICRNVEVMLAFLVYFCSYCGSQYQAMGNWHATSHCCTPGTVLSEPIQMDWCEITTTQTFEQSTNEMFFKLRAV